MDWREGKEQLYCCLSGNYRLVDGPLEPWFDKTWRPGEIELVK
jgi:hypothetical protein